mmetsp:Transcript_36526/g.117101  ORF Transcript_36526/g.117101 Transcript_36526/m.117101 type:complete len:712 (-) Transcript_36526:766-2901(-)
MAAKKLVLVVALWSWPGEALVVGPTTPRCEVLRMSRGSRRRHPEESPPPPVEPAKRPSAGAKGAALAAAEALEAMADERKTQHKKKKRTHSAAPAATSAATSAAAKKEDPAAETRPQRKPRAEVKPWEEMGIQARLRLRGVAAAESAAAAAEMAAAAAALEDDDLRTLQKASSSSTGGSWGVTSSLDASEAAAVAMAFNSSNWPRAYLVGLELTSRKGKAKLAEMRSRGGRVSGKVLEAASATADWSVDDSLGELARLCETARLRVVGRTYQRLERANGATLVGKGKLAEIAEELVRHEGDAVVFDDELTLGQQRSVLAELATHPGITDPSKVQVLDRTQLVLQIFSERARTREAKTQVALARAEYMLPRLATFMTTGAGMESRGGSAGSGDGGAYLRGAGESQLEMDRRLFTKRIQRLKADLEDVASKRSAARRRKLEQSDDLPLVAIVGYTNAGKTSLLNALSETAEALYADDRLFATLDPATRRVNLPKGRACKLTDTVGFLQKLPTRLIASFRATLEEITDASLLVHVVDCSSDLAKRHVDAVNAIVAELGCADIPQIRVLNKLDKVVDVVVPDDGGDGDGDKRVHQSSEDHHRGEDVDPAALAIGARVVARTSATRGDGIEDLLHQIEAALSAMNEQVHVLVPFTQGNLLNMIYTTGTIVDLEHLEEGTRIRARVPPALQAKLADFNIDDDDVLLEGGGSEKKYTS